MPNRTLPLVPTLVSMLHPQVMVLLGKLANPMTGKMDRDVTAAKAWIDLLGELEEKTEGRLEDGERKLLARTLSELRMNYLDEMSKPAPVAESIPAAEPGQAAETAPAAAPTEPVEEQQ